jgi:hypothetical protein
VRHNSITFGSVGVVTLILLSGFIVMIIVNTVFLTNEVFANQRMGFVEEVIFAVDIREDLRVNALLSRVVLCMVVRVKITESRRSLVYLNILVMGLERSCRGSFR